MLSAVTNLELAIVTDDELDPELEAIATGPARDVIAHVRLIVRVVSIVCLFSVTVYLRLVLVPRYACHPCDDNVSKTFSGHSKIL